MATTRILIDSNNERQHQKELEDLAKNAKACISIATAYLTTSSIIPNIHNDLQIRLLTSFTADDLRNRAVSLHCLKDLVSRGVLCKVVTPRSEGIFHPKVYLFDDKTAVISSLNMTDRALNANTEVGIIFDDTAAIRKLRTWFVSEWNRATKLDLETIKRIQSVVKLRKPKPENPADTKLDNLLNELFAKDQLGSLHGNEIDLVKLKNECLHGIRAVYLGNSNRKHAFDELGNNTTTFPQEEAMFERNEFMAWGNKFNSIGTLQNFRNNGVIFMHSKRLGITAIGLINHNSPAKSRPSTIEIEGSDEWFIHVKWIAKRLKNPYHFLGGNSTFVKKDIRKNKKLIKDVFDHFLKFSD